MRVLEYLGIAVVLCAVSYLFERAYINGGKKSKALFFFVCLFFIPSFPVSALFYECRRAIEKNVYEKQQEAARVAATIAAIEALPEDLRESAWPAEAWRSWRSRLTYNEWCCHMLEEYDLPEEIFLPSFWPRTEIQKLRETSTRS